jgi:hypothetical protein
VDQVVIVAASLGGGLLLGWALFALIGASQRRARRAVSRARGADRPDWAPGIWMCAHCRSSNTPTADRCTTCRRPREVLTRPPAEALADLIPDHVVVPPRSAVALIHHPAAHTDPGEAHWSIRVGGQTVGVAARRDGALALMRAIEGTDTIALDVRGTGPSTYQLADVIVRFAGPGFPLDVPCPERGR